MNEIDRICNTIFISIPIDIDYKQLGLTTNEEKQAFVDTFLQDVINLPLIESIKSENSELTDKVIGVITEAKQIEDYNIKIFAMSVAHIETEFSQLPTTVDNSNDPLGKKIRINGVNLSFGEKENKNFFEITQKQRKIADRIKEHIDKKDW